MPTTKTTTTAVRVRDLPEHPRPGVMLYCYRCGGEWSATRGDYFMAAPDHVFRCEHCPRQPTLTLVERRTIHRAIEEDRV